MHTFEIIKKAFYLPFKAYKGFILVTFLFFISEIITEMINQIEIVDLTMPILLIDPISGIIILGISIAVVYHYIDDSFDIRDVSITATAKAGFKDTFIESYYYILTITITAIISYALGIYHSIDSVISGIMLVDNKISSLTLPKLVKYLSPDAYHQLAFSVMATLAIFIILFAISFSYCSLAKIRLKETGNMAESMNFIKLTKIIKSKGIKKYMNFIILTFIVFSAVLLIMKTLEYYFIIGSVISALTESFALFFILDSFSLFYHY